MDWNQHHTSNLVYAPKDCGKVVDSIVYALDPDSPVLSSSCVAMGTKIKYNTVDHAIHLKDGSSLVLGLGTSSSSCTGMCSKGVADYSSMDLGLSINAILGGNRTDVPNKVSTGTSNEAVERRPAVDLELSLSTGLTESVVTTITPQEFIRCQSFSELPVLAPALQLVDEGSTSSRWKVGPRIPPLKSQELPAPFDKHHLCGNSIRAVPNNLSSAVASNLDGGASSGAVKNKPKHKISVKPCQIEGCTRGARGSSGLCIAHGGGRRCQKPGCQRGAEGKTVFCKGRCQYLGCTKSAEGRTDYCITHGGGRRCSHEGCTRASRGKSGLCIRHGGGKRCKVENCTRSAEGISSLCISHGGGRRCQFPECTKGAQGSTMYCKAHGGGKRCTYLGCTKGAEGSTPFCKGHGGGKRCTAEGCPKSVHGGTLFCVSHGGGKRCAMPECTKSARGRTDYCVRHGGGKRCKFDGCPRSAQGSTDFCKSHGGGRRCSWGQLGLEFGNPVATPCDKFARGKSGLCAAHTTKVQEMAIRESSTTFAAGTSTSYTGTSIDYGTSFGSTGYAQQFASLPVMARENFSSELDRLSLPEGRVHGGKLMAMLRDTAGASNISEEASDPSELDKSIHMSHKWV